MRGPSAGAAPSPQPGLQPFPPAALLVAWGTAVVRGLASPDDVVAVLGGDEPHRVRGLPGEDGEVGLTVALGRLRAAAVAGLRLVLPVPGDPGGLPGPASFNHEAVQAGQAALTVGGPALGLLPVRNDARPATAGPGLRWEVHSVERSGTRAGVASGESLAEVERSLRESVTAAVDGLGAADVAQARPGVRAALTRADEACRERLPPGYPQRAHRVLAMACRLDAITALGRKDTGAAYSAGAAERRAAHLAAVATSTRHAVVAAVNAWAEPAVGG